MVRTDLFVTDPLDVICVVRWTRRTCSDEFRQQKLKTMEIRVIDDDTLLHRNLIFFYIS